MGYDMTFYFRRAPIWIVLNLIGMATYLRLGSDLWTSPGDDCLTGGMSVAGGMHWLFLMLPVLMAYLVFDSISLSAIIQRIRRTGRLTSLYIWLAIAILWIVAFRYNNLRSLIDICAYA